MELQRSLQIIGYDNYYHQSLKRINTLYRNRTCDLRDTSPYPVRVYYDEISRGKKQEIVQKGGPGRN